MSRHRDVRNMDFSDDYDGYDDVYGHSVDDDFYISPSNRQFMFNRENSREQPKIGEYIQTEQDIKEEDESQMAMELSNVEKGRLESCLNQVESTLGPTSLSRRELINLSMSHNFNVDKVINAILNEQEQPFFPQETEEKQKGVTKSPSLKFIIPKIDILKVSDTQSPHKMLNVKTSKSNDGFVLPKFNSAAKPNNFTIPKLGCGSLKKDSSGGQTFNNLSDLVSNHLNKSIKIPNIQSSKSDANIGKILSIGSLKIDSPPSSSKSNSTLTNPTYKIDLSTALRGTSSTSIISNKSRQNVKVEDFEIPFVDCDADLEKDRKILACKLDSSDMLKAVNKNVKAASNFGRILCYIYRRKYKRPQNADEEAFKKLPRFSFRTPSPDDLVKTHIKKT